MNRLTKLASASGIALGMILGTGITAANAEEAPDSAEAVFNEFVDALKVDAKTDAALTEQFDDLPPAEQERVADAIEENPLSVMEFDAGAPTLTSGTGTTPQPALAHSITSSIKTAAHHNIATTKRASERNAASGLHIQTAAAAPRYTATYPVNASLFGITTGTFNMRSSSRPRRPTSPVTWSARAGSPGQPESGASAPTKATTSPAARAHARSSTTCRLPSRAPSSAPTSSSSSSTGAPSSPARA